MSFVDFRLKIRHFFRKNKKILIVIFIVWAIIFLINMILKNMPEQLIPNITYEAHTSVINQGSSTPRSLREPIEDVIDEYIECCNDGNYQKAFSMLSEDCRKYEFNDDVEKFMEHVLTKMPRPKKYSIQDYSNYKYGNKNMYVYEIKYIDDILATGLTNSTYAFTSEKITFFQNNDELEMNVGDYMYSTDIKSISENEYLKIDVVNKLVRYSTETYDIKLTNRSNYTIVVADGQEADEILLALPQETRSTSITGGVVIRPQETISLQCIFPKFVDDGDESQSIIFSAIRVMEKYSGTSDDVSEETIQSEIDNAISKFSMEVSVTE